MATMGIWLSLSRDEATGLPLSLKPSDRLWHTPGEQADRSAPCGATIDNTDKVEIKAVELRRGVRRN